MVMKLLSEGHEVVVWNRSAEKIENLKLKSENFGSRKNLKAADSVQNLVKELKSPRVVWSMLPAGEPTEEILMGPEGVADWVEEGDIVIDGGNSYFEDTQRRYEYFTNKGILFLGIGVSGGIIAAKDGYPMMVGGSVEGYELIKPVLESLAKPNGGHEYFGEGGAGHFVKMVHNGIEYGIMQSIGEGFGVLSKSSYNLDLVKVARLYQKGTLVSGFMMQRTIEALEKDPKLASIEGYIEESGEGRWTVEQAKKLGVPVEVIEKSLEFRVKSRKNPKIAASFAAKLVAAMRAVFGGHEVKKK